MSQALFRYSTSGTVYVWEDLIIKFDTYLENP